MHDDDVYAFAAPYDEDTAAAAAAAAGLVLTPVPPTAPPATSFATFLIVQTCHHGPFRWLRVLLEQRRHQGHAVWAFPRVGIPSGAEATDEGVWDDALAQCMQRLQFKSGLTKEDWAHLGALSKGGLHPLFIHRIRARTTLLMVCLPPWTVPADKPSSCTRVHPSIPDATWAIESEFFEHDVIGGPCMFGVPICPFAVEAWQALPSECQFASTRPPLVLYHGTGESMARQILRDGCLKPGLASEWAMLGAGVYLARWDKALDFAQHTVDNIERVENGVVLRIVVCGIGCTDTTLMRVLGPEDVCTCGCFRAFVDHDGHQRPGQPPVTMVPDRAGGAVRRAEWCVRRPEMLVIQSAVRVRIV